MTAIKIQQNSKDDFVFCHDCICYEHVYLCNVSWREVRRCIDCPCVNCDCFDADISKDTRKILLE